MVADEMTCPERVLADLQAWFDAHKTSLADKDTGRSSPRPRPIETSSPIADHQFSTVSMAIGKSGESGACHPRGPKRGPVISVASFGRIRPFLATIM